MRMPMNLKRCVWILAVVLSMSIAGGSLRAAVPASPQDQAHNQDYSKNKKYQQGVREGQNDSKRNLDHSKKRNFKKDEDQKAYETGYQQGRQVDQHR
jgi:hypothetical protein